MIRTQATAQRDAQGKPIYQACCHSACKSCDVNRVCGASRRTLALDAELMPQAQWQENAEVYLDIREEELLRLTLLAYFLPCLLVVGLAWAASPLGDFWSGAGALIGLISGLLLSHRLLQRKPPHIELVNPTQEPSQP